jgi:hypothetical protein
MQNGYDLRHDGSWGTDCGLVAVQRFLCRSVCRVGYMAFGGLIFFTGILTELKLHLYSGANWHKLWFKRFHNFSKQ